MNDNDFIKVLEYCLNYRNGHCDNCPYREDENGLYCVRYIPKKSLEIISRQKAEIQSLNEQEKILICQLAEERDKAIKEFADRLKGKAKMPLGTLYGQMVYAKDIDNLVKEMTEGDNGGNNG